MSELNKNLVEKKQFSKILYCETSSIDFHRIFQRFLIIYWLFSSNWYTDMSRRAINHITKFRASHKERESKKKINGTKLFRPSKKILFIMSNYLSFNRKNISHSINQSHVLFFNRKRKTRAEKTHRVKLNDTSF